MKRKTLALLLIAGITVSLLSGCGNAATKTDETTEPSATSTVDTTAKQETVKGQVTAIDGDLITLALGVEETQNAAAGETDSPDDRAAAATSGGLTLTGEEQTFTVSESTAIEMESGTETSTGTLQDITVGSILTVTLSGDTAQVVIISGTGDTTGDDQESTASGEDAAAETGEPATT